MTAGFVCGMRVNYKSNFILACAMIVLPVAQIRAQETTGETNDVLTLKQLMANNHEVTNTVGMVLVKISPDLWAAKFETTQEAYEKIAHSNPSTFQSRERPVDSVSWNDAISFCSKLTDKERAAKELPDGYGYTLPTEDQWKSLVADAKLSDAVMKLNNGVCSSTAPVGSLGSNSLGLYDMRGNVMEWVLNSRDPSYRILKGGAWDTFVEINARPEFQWRVSPNDKKSSYGFRVILSDTSK
jgi:formylglycine-generating enzyme required for sulfatase activity